MRPLVVRGWHFRFGERVTVTATGSRPVVRHAIAHRGAFSVQLGTVPSSRCLGLWILAAGSLGSKARLWLPRPACMPVPLPAGAGGRSP